jgi:hypothetical protein
MRRHNLGTRLLPRTRRDASAGLLLLGLVLGGCAGHPKGVMAPVLVTGATGGSSVDMLVVTSRVPSDDPATLFTGERSPVPI